MSNQELSGKLIERLHEAAYLAGWPKQELYYLAVARMRELIAENEALKKGAERYRWLKQKAILREKKERMQFVWEMPLLPQSGDYPYIRNDSIDAAIDTAITEENKHN